MSYLLRALIYLYDMAVFLLLYVPLRTLRGRRRPWQKRLWPTRNPRW